MRKLCLIIISLLLLYGCAGTGTKSYSDVAHSIDEDVKKVFIYRDDGFVGSALLMQVRLNGTEIAKLGIGEMVVGDGAVGTNTLEVEIGGLGGIGMNTPTVTFDLVDDQNRYFILNIKQKFFSVKIQIMETLKSAWQAQVKE